MKQTLSIFLVFWAIDLQAQEVPNPKDTGELTFGAYVDAYYAWYDNANEVALQQHNCIGAYHNNLGLNIAQLTGSYAADRVRGTVTVHFGDIPQITWANQYRPLQEAHAGARLARRLWLDLGFFKTHVGAESFLPKDNLMSIITLGTFYGPFYQSGARLSYDTRSGWHMELHAINGYNQHIDNNDSKTVGILVSHTFSKKVSMSYSNMLGREQTGRLDDGDFLVYQNLYSDIALGRLDLQIGGDVATVPNRADAGGNVNWLIAALITAKYRASDHFAFSIRGECFYDPSSINSLALLPEGSYGPGTPPVYPSRNRPDSDGLEMFGGTVGLEYAPSSFGFLRLESRTLYNANASVSEYPLWYSARESGLNPVLNTRTSILATMGIYFDKVLKFAR